MTEETEKKMVGVVMALVLLLLWMPFSIAITGCVLVKLWAWFIVPLGVMSIGMWHALGLSTFISFFKFGIASTIDVKTSTDENFDPLSYMIGHIIGYLIFVMMTLCFGYFFHRMMPL